jgi:hypothetical protein
LAFDAFYTIKSQAILPPMIGGESEIDGDTIMRSKDDWDQEI